jgi:hypothetical protein
LEKRYNLARRGRIVNAIEEDERGLHMAGYKYPPLIEFRAELPMTAGDEVLKSELGS